MCVFLLSLSCLSFLLLLLVASCFSSCIFALYCVYVMCLRFSFRFSLLSLFLHISYFALIMHFSALSFPFFLVFFFRLQGFTLRIRNVSFHQFENSLESCSFTSRFLFLASSLPLSLTLSILFNPLLLHLCSHCVYATLSTL